MAKVRITRRELMAAAGAASLWPAMTVATPGTAVALRAAPSIGTQPEAFSALLRLEPAQPGHGNHRWAIVAEGEITGGTWTGPLLSGRLDWHVDPASGAAEAVATCRVRGPQGRALQLRRAQLTATRLDNGCVLLRSAS